MKKKLLVGFVSFLIMLPILEVRDQHPEWEKYIQVGVWSTMVFAILILANVKHFRHHWFWEGLVAAIMVHGYLLFVFSRSIPFRSFGVAILMCIPEVLVLQTVFKILSARSESLD